MKWGLNNSQVVAFPPFRLPQDFLASSLHRASHPWQQGNDRAQGDDAWPEFDHTGYLRVPAKRAPGDN